MNNYFIVEIFGYSDDGDVCLDDREIFLADELCEDAEHYRRSDVNTPTPQSPRPPSTGKFIFITFMISIGSCPFPEVILYVHMYTSDTSVDY